MSSSVHQHHLNHQHYSGSSDTSLNFLNSALVSILSNKYPELSLNDDAIMYIKYLVMKIIKILMSGHTLTLGHSSSSPLATSSGTLITNAIGSTNGPTVGSLSSSSSRSSSSSSSVLIRLGDLKERINLLFPCKLDQEIIQKADKILFDLNSSSHDSTLYREGYVNENSSTGNLRSSLLNQTGISKLSGKSRKPPSKHKLNKISSLTSAHVIHIPYLSFSHFFRELLGGGKDIKFDPDPDVIIYMIVVIEHIVTDILESSGKFVSNIPEKTTISKEDVRISMYAGTMIKSLFNPDDEVNYDHEDAILCLQPASSCNTSTIMNNPGSNHSSSTTTPAPSSLCFFSLDLDPKFISKLIENKENEKLLKLQPLSLTGSLTQACTDVNVNDSLSHSSTGTNAGGYATNNFHRSSQLMNMNQSVTYEDVVKELISEEKFFIRDLQLIIKLFREPFLEVMKQQETDSSSLPSSPTSPASPPLTSASLMSTVALLNDQQSSVPSSPIHKSFGTRIKASDIDAIFSNITDIEELSVKLLCCLEDTLEAMISSNLSNDDLTKTGSGNNLSGSNPGSVTSMSKSVIESIGSVFQDFAEDQEFDVYETFASDIIGYHHALHLQNNNNNNSSYGGNKNNVMNNQLLNGHSNWSTSPSNQVLQELLADSMISKALATARNGFVKENKYILHKFFNRIIYHCYTYFNYISILKSLSPSEEDKESFSVVEGLLKPLELKLGMITGITFRAGIKVPVLFGQNFFTLHHPGLISSTTSPSANTGTLNPSSGVPTSLASAKMVTSFCPLMSHSLNLSSVNTNHEIMDLISKIDGLDMTTHQHMNCLVLVGSLYKSSSATGKAHPKISERRAFLFDGVLLLCKDVLPSKKSTTVGSISGASIHYGQTKRYLISKIEVTDLPDPPIIHSSASFSVGSALNKGSGDPCCGNSVINPSLPGHLQSSNEDHLGELPSASALSSPWGMSTTSLLSISSNTLIPGSGIHSKSDYISRVKNAFKINVRDSKEFIVLSTDTPESKNLWISNLIFLTSRPNLEKTLESILIEEDRKNPLQIPSPSVYQFSVPDSESNIIFEVDKFNNAGAPLIKAATMAKLIERLTYHLHADPTFVRVFLTTYRSFSTPRELLTLLIDRFNVPDIESKAREDVKKFEKDYVNPVQLRVLNVIRTWVAHHYYDFTNDEELLNDLIFFLEKKAGKSKTKLKKWVDSILKNIYKNKEIAYNNIHAADLSLLFNSNPPHFEWHIISAENVSNTPKDMFNLLTIHPIEFARQFTLLEYDLFKKVKPSEIVDCAWTKSDKERKSPNLLRFTNFGNNFTYWLEQQILEAENFEERVAVYSRILEILQVFQELNNFDGIICTVAALTSAAVYRLESTKEAMPKALKKSFEEAEKLNQGHHKKYFEMLRSINPPCVPFLGKYLTYIVQIHEGNTDETHISVRDELRSYATGETIATSTLSLINFSKRRKVAEITQEIQQYQNTPYCLNPEPHIREFLESIKPLESSGFVEYLKRITIEKGSDQVPDVFSMGKDERVKHFHDYLQEMSLDIEPRKMSDGTRKPVKKADRRWPEMSLKSPGIKPSQPPPMAALTVTSSGSNPNTSSSTLSNTLSRARGVFASAVATSGLSSSSSSHKSPIQSNNLNEMSLPMESSSQISPNAVTLTLHSGSSFEEKDHYPINLPSNAGSCNSHHHHVRQSSLTHQQQGSGIHGSFAHHSVDVPISMSSSLHSFSDYSVFAPVLIGGNNSNNTHSSYPPLTPVPSTPLTPGHRSQFLFSGSNPPPALPPRRQRLASTTSQSYDESMSSHCSGGSGVTLQPPPRPPHPITPLIPSTPSTPGSSTTSYSGQSQSKNFFNFPPPLPPPEAVPPVIPPRPEKLSKLINSATASSEYLPVESNIPGTSSSEGTSPPPLPPRGIQPPLVHRHLFHRGSGSQSLYQTSPSPSTTPRHAS